MPIDQLPGEIVVPTRDDIIAKWKRSHRLRVPDADVGPGTQPDVDAQVAADALVPLYAAAVTIGKNAVLEEARGAASDQWGEREGVGERREAVGASGFVTISTSSGGGPVVEDDELVHEDSGLVYRALATQVYANGDSVPVIGKDTGTQTNLLAGAQLRWSSPRPGVGQIAIVIEQSDGSGLSGGRERESDEEYNARIAEEKQTRAASGNDAEYQLLVQNTPSVAVQKAFSYPAITGAVSTCVVFTMRPLYPGGSRIPNPAQVGLVEAFVAGEMPGDDSAFFALLDEEDVDIVLGVTWVETAAGWADVAPWPPYYEAAGTPGAVIVSAATSPTSFTLKCDGDDYTGVQQPQTGQTIAFFDSAELEFVQKRILSFAGSGPWVITVDTTNSASDTAYTPVVGQRAMPWSDSLDTLLYTAATDDDPASGILAYMDRLGPGEQVASFYDEGRRQKRQPRPPKNWPSTLTTRDITNSITSEDVEDVEVLEGDGEAPSVGTPGMLSYILKLRYLSVFPQTD